MTFIIIVFAGLGLFQFVRGIIALRGGESQGHLHLIAAAACALVTAGLVYYV